MFKTIEVNLETEHGELTEVIDYTQDAKNVIDALSGLYRKSFGDKFGDAQVAELNENQYRQIQSMLEVDLQHGVILFHRATLDDGKVTFDKIKIDKIEA